MVVTTPTPTSELEVRTVDGHLQAFLVPAAQMEQMRAELESLRTQVATLQRQKNHYVAELTRVLQTSIPLPPTEDEVMAAEPDFEEPQKLIADLEDATPVFVPNLPPPPDTPPDYAAR